MNQSSKTSSDEKLKDDFRPGKKSSLYFKRLARPLGFIPDFVHHQNRKNQKNVDQIVDDLQYVTSQGNNHEQKYRDDPHSFLTGYNNLHPCVFNPSSFCIPKFQPVFRGSYPAFSGFPVSLCRLFLLYLTYFSACESHTLFSTRFETP